MMTGTGRRSAVLILCILLVVSGTAGAGVAAATTAPTPAVGFADGLTTDQRGDVTTITIRLVDTDHATLLIRAAQRDYSASLQVRDGNGDGTVQVRFNTFRGLERPDEPAFGAADDADSVTVLYQSTEQTLPIMDAGRYNLIASSGDSRVAAVLQLEGGAVGASETRVTPPGGNVSVPAENGSEADGADAEQAQETTDEALTLSIDRDRPERVAKGDHIESRFGVSGVGGALETRPPAENLVFANDSALGADTTHVLQFSPDESTEVRSLTVDYGAGDGSPPTNFYQLSVQDIEALGVDRTGDGAVDQSLRGAIASTRTDTSGEMTLYFDRPVNVTASDRILAEYAVTNPDTTGADDVSVSLNEDAYTETGTVVYGPAGDGTLGHGLDLRIEATDGSPEITAPLGATTVEYDSATNEIVARTSTDELALETYAVNLTISESSPFVDQQTALSEQFRVERPTAQFENVTATDTGLEATAQTNLAPGNQLIIQIQAMPRDGGSSYLSQCVTPVGEDRTLSCEFDLSRPASAYSIEVSVIRNSSVLSGPVSYE
jgi:hypothetical protein